MSLLYTFLPYLEDYILQINNLWLSDLVSVHNNPGIAYRPHPAAQ